MKRPPSNQDPCAGCNGSRREFVRGTASALAGILVGISGLPADLSALPIRWAQGRLDGPDELSFPLPVGDSVTIDKENELILVRWAARLYAFALSCPHQRSMLKWRAGDSMFQCTKHKSRYQPDGSFVSGRATRGMDRFPLRITGGKVVVQLGEAILQDEDATAWNAASVALDA